MVYEIIIVNVMDNGIIYSPVNKEFNNSSDDGEFEYIKSIIHSSLVLKSDKTIEAFKRLENLLLDENGNIKDDKKKREDIISLYAGCLNLGMGCYKDSKKAMKYQKIAADLGDIVSMRNYAIALEAEHFFKESVSYYLNATKKGDNVCMERLLQLALTTSNENKKSLFDIFKKEKENNPSSSIAMFNYARAHQFFPIDFTNLTPEKLEEVEKVKEDLYKKAAEMEGYPYATYQYGLMLQNAAFKEVKPYEGLKYIRMAADRGQAEAKILVEIADETYKKANDTSFSVDERKDFYVQAMKMGHIEATFEHSSTLSPVLSLRNYKDLADSGYIPAIDKFIELSKQTEQSDIDDYANGLAKVALKSCVDSFEKQANEKQDDYMSMYNYARCLEAGLKDGKENLELAIQFYKKAEELGLDVKPEIERCSKKMHALKENVTENTTENTTKENITENATENTTKKNGYMDVFLNLVHIAKNTTKENATNNFSKTNTSPYSNLNSAFATTMQDVMKSHEYKNEVKNATKENTTENTRRENATKENVTENTRRENVTKENTRIENVTKKNTTNNFSKTNTSPSVDPYSNFKSLPEYKNEVGNIINSYSSTDSKNNAVASCLRSSMKWMNDNWSKTSNKSQRYYIANKTLLTSFFVNSLKELKIDNDPKKVSDFINKVFNDSTKDNKLAQDVKKMVIERTNNASKLR